MSHSNFTQRPNYQQQFSCQQLRDYTVTESRAGHYNLTTLWWYRKLWLRTGKGYDYLAYLSFRRALGYPLNASKAAYLQRYLQNGITRLWHRLFGHRLRQSHNLLAEYYYRPEQAALVAAVPQRYQRQVAYWRAQQQHWHHQFTQYLQQAGKIHLVGNSPILAGSNNGATIDSADVVIRFNQYQSSHTQACDTGIKCNVWVMAPAFAGEVPAKLDWCLVSGPNMLWQQQRWPQLINPDLNVLSDLKLLSIPLANWRALVRQLAAPPSAGLLVIHFIASVINKPDCIHLSGFGYNSSTSQYHYAKPDHHAVSRHNWQAEYQLLQDWQQSTERYLIS